jgi:hypothetical protein
MLSGEHYLASNFLLYTYYVQIVQVEDMKDITKMLWWKQIMCVDFYVRVTMYLNKFLYNKTNYMH